MAPVSSIGAAGIITSSGEEMDPVMRKKAESAFWAFTRSVVTEKGYRPEVVKAMMIPSDQEQQFGPVKLEKGALLTLTGKEAATRLEDGRPLLAQGTATSVTDLLAQEKVDAPTVTAEPTAFERIGLWIAWASPILILLGIGGIYMEFKTPGFGIGGIVAIAAFALFFFGNNIAGNLAGYETAALLILGVVLLCVEFFVIPGTFIAAIAGGICIFLALFGGMISSWEWDHIIRDGPVGRRQHAGDGPGHPPPETGPGPDRGRHPDRRADEVPAGLRPDAPRHERHGSAAAPPGKPSTLRAYR